MRVPSAIVMLANVWLGGCACSKPATEPQPIITEDASAPPDPPELGCSEGMLLVPGGGLSEQQRTRWADWLADGGGTVEPFCLDRLLVSHADVRRHYEVGCPDPTTCFKLQGRSDRNNPDIHRRLEAACPDSSKCVHMHMSSVLVHAEQQDKPYATAFKRASELCGTEGKRLPTAQEWLWAAAGGQEDRRYPWGNEPLDGTRARVFDEGDYEEAIESLERDCKEAPSDAMCLQEQDCQENPESQECPGSAAEAVAQGRPATIDPPFPWDDGHVGYQVPVGSFPAGDGRWGHRRLFPAQLVQLPGGADSRTRGHGMCGLVPHRLDPGAIANMHTTETCGERRYTPPLFRCAAAPQSRRGGGGGERAGR